jgi:hypothetical protein
MAKPAIDLNRGVTIRIHRSGVRVHMYKDEPGVYRNVYGEVVGEEVAKEAGFDTDKLKREHARQTEIAEQIAKINEAYGAEKDKVIYEKDGFKVLGMGDGRYNVISPDGHILTDLPLGMKEAKKLVEKLAKDE